MRFAYKRISITGAAGSGTTTLGVLLAERIEAKHLEVDDLMWEDTAPPFQRRRAPAERTDYFVSAIAGVDHWVLSGSLLRWGDELAPLFDLAVFLHIPQDERLARLRRRERQKFGSAIDPGGSQHASYCDFMRLAEGYEDCTTPVNNIDNARAWLRRLECPVLEIDGLVTTGESLSRVLAFQRQQPAD